MLIFNLNSRQNFSFIYLGQIRLSEIKINKFFSRFNLSTGYKIETK